MFSPNRSFGVAAVLAATIGFASTAFAGPPLICHPFTTDLGAPLLPWAEGRDWHQPKPGYDRANLVADTLGLLSPDAPILDRMENMRRATIYADENPRMAAELLRAVVERTKTKPADARAEALEWFDAGYLVETYRQLGLIYQHEMRPEHSRWTSLVPEELAEVDGYALVQKALALAPESQAELDFASALMSREPLAATHLRRAASGAADRSLLAQNLEHYDVR
ncbi:MAG TPA: hypothetical protein VN818_01325 [Gammaproteobacteria bacterium]|nr:hypothetical protein [Gammaproteobacteria bacterium]